MGSPDDNGGSVDGGSVNGGSGGGDYDGVYSVKWSCW